MSNMKWSVHPAQDAATEIVSCILELAKTKHSLLLLVSGGSAIATEADIIERLTDCPNILGVLPIDERFGVAGHPNSNIAQLVAKTSLSNKVAVYDVLSKNLPFDQTVEQYSSLAQDLFARADYILGIFGIGSDGHTAGILPGSPAANDTIATVIGYNWQDYERMTLGVSNLTTINQAFVLAYGENKQQALHDLMQNTQPFEQLPAKLFYDIADVTIYNDYITSDEEHEE